MELGTIPAWVAVALALGSFAYTRYATNRTHRRNEEVRWSVTWVGNGNGGGVYELRNQGRKTAYRVIYKVPLEVFTTGQDTVWSDEDDIPVRLPLDIPGGSAIYIAAFKVMGSPDPRVYVWWYDRPDQRGTRQEWITELPPRGQ
ncbi:hypothetical protein GCM10009818_38610 [Nakamurella flavida]|uniref:hypothetical protein n=1 Tax=Nakamurella flavida TaxID=363630 RepID=UPI0031DB8973